MKEHLYGGNDVERFEHVCVGELYCCPVSLVCCPSFTLKIIRNFLSNLI